MRLRACALSFGVVVVFGAPVAAQSVVLAPSILRVPASTRALGMGNVGIASRDDDVLFYDPAQLAVARGTSAQVEWFPDQAHGGTVSSVLRFGKGGLAVGASAVDYRTPAFISPGLGGLSPGGFDATSLVGSIGIGQTFKGFRIGAAAKYAEETSELARFAFTTADVGLARDIARIVTVALSVQNLGATSDDDAIVSPNLGTRVELPLRETLGAAVSTDAGPFDLTATAAAMYGREEQHVRAAGGVELGWSWLSGYEIAVRAGARDPEPGEEAFTAGAGFTRDRVSIDYAIETLAGSRVAHRIGVRVRGP
jgi:hypothetical protein